MQHQTRRTISPVFESFVVRDPDRAAKAGVVERYEQKQGWIALGSLASA